jgi:aryl-alcohol dehydrogenase-like predicted oxidoreductase
MRGRLTDREANAKVQKLEEVAGGLGCSLAQLAIAWCAANPRVSTVITGASRVEQVKENLGALDVIPKLDADERTRIDAVLR